MPGMVYEVRGQKELLEKMENRRRFLENPGWIMDLIRPVAGEMVIDIKLNTPVNTGAARDGWEVRESGPTEIMVTHPYLHLPDEDRRKAILPVIENGSVIHKIVPVNAPALVFEHPKIAADHPEWVVKEPDTVALLWVNHPGTPPHYPVRRARIYATMNLAKVAHKIGTVLIRGGA